ncbi:MAG: hypothetical protein AAGB46_13335, partial [Verrucomicrobiota bacterium]
PSHRSADSWEDDLRVLLDALPKVAEQIGLLQLRCCSPSLHSTPSDLESVAAQLKQLSKETQNALAVLSSSPSYKPRLESNLISWVRELSQIAIQLKNSHPESNYRIQQALTQIGSMR